MEQENEEKKGQDGPIKLADLNVDERKKKILSLTFKGSSIGDIAAKLDLAYSTVNQDLIILTSKNLVRKTKTLSGKSFYHLNQQKVEL